MGFGWRNDFDWLAEAGCRGAPSELFYEEPLPFDGPVNKAALERARAVCGLCPSRLECAEHAFHEEAQSALADRDGVRAGMTPAQRVSIERRGGLRGADPLSLIEGWDDAAQRRVPPVPDEGDRWSRHHTTLAHKVLRWLRANVPAGERLPSQAAICEAIPCKPGPLRIVLDALVADGTLDLHGPAERRVGDNGSTRYYVRRELPRAIRRWQPPHLREESQ